MRLPVLCALSLFWVAVVGCTSQKKATHDAGQHQGGDGDAPSDRDATAGDGDASTTHEPDAGDAATHDAGPSEEDKPFDTTTLSIDGDQITSFCRLSDDGNTLIVRVHNTASADSLKTTLEVKSHGSNASQRVLMDHIAATTTLESKFDRGALAGWGETWDFDITIDPDGRHGKAGTPVTGQCKYELRSRAAIGTQVLMGWYDQDSGLFNKNEWWRGANMTEVVIDAMRELGDGSYLAQIDNAFEKARHKNDAVFSQDNFLNDYYDDEGWWALTWIKAYDLTHDSKYLDMAKVIFKDMTGGWSDDLCGGGLFWRKERDGKNAIPNELFLTIAARLHTRTPGDAGAGSFLDWAQREWTWFKGTGMIQDDYSIVDGIGTSCVPGGARYTYNQGVILGGLAELARATGDSEPLDAAQHIADTALTKMVNADGVFIEAVCDPNCGGGDGVQFKGVFARNLAELYALRPDPRYRAFFIRQSDAIWQKARSDANQFAQLWEGPFDNTPDASRQSSALDAIIGAVRVAHMNMAIGGKASGGAGCSATEGPDRAFDGNQRSKWCSGGAGDQTLNLDLGSVRQGVGFRVQHAGAGGEDAGWNTRDFELETSMDGQTYTPQVKITGNVDNVTTALVPAFQARYVRLHVTNAQTRTDFLAARIYELEVLGISR